jgi:hypothetical protein
MAARNLARWVLRGTLAVPPPLINARVHLPRGVTSAAAAAGSPPRHRHASTATPADHGTQPSHGSAAARAVAAAAERIVTPDVCAQLRHHGYAIVDGMAWHTLLSTSPKRILNTRFISSRHPMTWRAISAHALVDGALDTVIDSNGGGGGAGGMGGSLLSQALHK